jgi:glyoxylase-like metal-dependent hydrolase (beta-lactamase superfamily II)
MSMKVSSLLRFSSSLALVCAGSTAARRLEAQYPGFELVKVARGIYAALRTEPGRNIVNGNATVIVNDRDVVVVDATGTPASARELIAATRRVTPLPVSYLVLTHWHDDHVMGTQAFQDAFPGIRIVAHPDTRDSMTTIAARNRERYLKDLPPYLDYLERKLAADTAGTDAPLSDAERLGSASDLRLGRRYLAEAPRFRVTLPEFMVVHQLILKRGRRTIEIRHFGRGNTGGDLVVFLPRERVIITGDLVVWPTPYVFDSYPAEWADCLDSLRDRKARVLIPGHGPLLRDYRYPDFVAQALRSVVDQVEAATGRGLNLDGTRNAVDLEAFRRDAAGEDSLRNREWKRYFVDPVVAREYQQVTKRRKEAE